MCLYSGHVCKDGSGGSGDELERLRYATRGKDATLNVGRVVRKAVERFDVIPEGALSGGDDFLDWSARKFRVFLGAAVFPESMCQQPAEVRNQRTSHLAVGGRDRTPSIRGAES